MSSLVLAVQRSTVVSGGRHCSSDLLVFLFLFLFPYLFDPCLYLMLTWSNKPIDTTRRLGSHITLKPVSCFDHVFRHRKTPQSQSSHPPFFLLGSHNFTNTLLLRCFPLSRQSVASQLFNRRLVLFWSIVSKDGLVSIVWAVCVPS